LTLCTSLVFGSWVNNCSMYYIITVCSKSFNS
jgi:hypothetical protein